MQTLLDLLFISLGLIFGSFVTALSYRSPKGISNLKGRSFCDRCKYQLAWYDNIPLFSYILLGGKCRNCGKNISIRYPLIELGSSLSFLFIGRMFSGSLVLLIYWLLIFLILLSIFIVDFEHQIIPDSFVFFGIFVVSIYTIFFIPEMFYSALFSGLISATFLLMIHIFTSGRGMGLGDVKFAVFGGMITGLTLSYIWLFLAFLTGGTVGIILILGQKAGLKDKIAFGPFLIVGLVLSLFIGRTLLRFIGI